MEVIAWEKASEQVGDDEEFLKEVLDDLLVEADAAVDEMKAAIEEKSYDGVMHPAHRMKGGASYLFCECLQDVSLRLQDLGKKKDSPGEKDWEEIAAGYEEFVACLEDLKVAIDEKFGSS
jgi:HPt (histidine-containing phosphotransfer) domain-containing protein